MRLIKFWMVILAGCLMLTACGDGSVRSPDVGTGPLESIRLECRTPAGGTCDTTQNGEDLVQAGAFVNYRVIGTFRNRSQIDITNRERIRLRLVQPAGGVNRATLTASGDNKGRVRGNVATVDGQPVVVLADDLEGDADPVEVSRELVVVGGLPQSVDIFGNASCTTSANDLPPRISGAQTQLWARITFDNPDVAPLCVSQDPRLTWSSPNANPDGSQVINPNTGVFTGKNADPENNAEFQVVATFAPEDDPDAPQFTPVQGNATLEVLPAMVDCDAGLRLTPSVARIVIGDIIAYQAEATFIIDGNTSVTASVTALTEFSSDGPAFADFLDPDDQPGVLTGIAATPDGSPVNVNASLPAPNCPGGALNTSSEVTVLDADFAALKLVAVGEEPFDEAGLFDFDASPAVIEAERERVRRDALILGLNENGRVPCSGDGCPNGELAQHQTMPGAVSLGYVVVGVMQGDGTPVVLRNMEVQCNGDILPVFVGGSDDTIDVLTELPPGQPARTFSGERVVLVDGLSEGTGTVRARLGADFSDPGLGHGFNCQETGFDGEFEQQPVADAEQDILVSVLDNGDPAQITATNFNIDKNFTCVGFTNASNLVDFQEIRGADKLLTALIYTLDDGRTVIVNANQSRHIGFGERLQAANQADGQQSCRDESATDPVAITLTKELLERRGIIIADSVLGLSTNCAKAEYMPAVPPPNFSGPTSRTATVLVLPVDDDILRGDSAISGETQELCDALKPIVTLPLIEEQGLVLELIDLLSPLLAPILNDDNIEGPLSDGLEELLNLVGSGLDGLISTIGLDPIVDPVLCLIGIGCSPPAESPTGFGVLPTLIEILQEVGEGLNEAFGGPPAEPDTVDPGDPFNEAAAGSG